MTLLCFALTVVVPVDHLEKKYPGGLTAYEAKANELGLDFCHDGEITGVYFRSPAEVGRWIDPLIGFGLTYFKGDEQDPLVEAQDIALIDMLTGPVFVTPWLSHSFESDRRFVWSADSARGEAVIPESFDIRAIEESVFVSNQQLAAHSAQMGPGVPFVLPGHLDYPRRGKSAALLALVASLILGLGLIATLLITGFT